MKTTVIPAQITSVEDKIAGNLSFTQILLLLGALFIATFIYLVFPPHFQFNIYKLVLMIVGSTVFLVLAIRVKGKILLQWLQIMSSYALRPRYYVFNKNDMYLRDFQPEIKPKKVKVVAAQKVRVIENDDISIADVLTVENTLLNPNRNVRYAFKKKGVYVSVS